MMIRSDARKRAEALADADYRKYMARRHYRRMALEATAERNAEELPPVFIDMGTPANDPTEYNDVWGDAR